MKLFFKLILSLSPLFCFSQQTDNSVCWRISGNGLKEPSYLFGTMHIVPEKEFFISDSVKTFLLSTKTLIQEIELKMSIKEQFQLVKQMMLPQGTTLRSLVDSALFYQMYYYFSDTLNIDESHLNRYMVFKPVYFEIMIISELVEKPQSYEMEFSKMAGRKLKFLALETAQEQMVMLDSTTFDLEDYIKTEKYKFKNDFLAMMNLYLDQDTDSLMKILNADENIIENTLLIQRNKNWMPKIIAAINDKPAFIAVGCAHLFNEYGLIMLLRKEGYIVEPVRISLRK